MEYENINSTEERIFPFYKGKYMGKENVGYANVKAATKYMQEIPKEDVFNKCFGGFETYKAAHSYLYFLSNIKEHRWCKPKSELFEPDLSTKPVYLTELDEQTRQQIIDDIQTLSELDYDVYPIYAKEFQKKYNLHHRILIDYDDFNKAYNKYIKEHVEFKKGILHKRIELL